ncbi:ANTAR domain-containing protein [Streptomyces viridochromogenes]|uniref:ANTAR domain-containing protein n=1 Tax=Streptomyces viridochromogenes TaxID=1938 RepID=UPI0031D5B7D2
MPELASVHLSAVGDAADAEVAGAPMVEPLPLVAALCPDGDRMKVVVRGELDLDSGGRFQRILRDALHRSVRGVDLDLRGVTFCDCAALNILLAVRQRALADGKTVALHGSSSMVDRLLVLTGTRDLFAGPDRPAVTRPPAQEAGDVTDRELRAELTQLRQAMRTRPTVDLARGILMAYYGLGPQDAWAVLVSAAERGGTEPHTLAGDLVECAQGGAQLPAGLRAELSSAIARVHVTDS